MNILLRDIKNWRYWITIAIVVKVLFAVLIFSQRIPADKKGVFYAYGGDTSSYFEPIENFIQKGQYSPDFRMPGYGALYFIFRQLFSQRVSCNLLVAVQLLLAGISVYILALAAMHIFDSTAMFYGVFYTYLLSTYTSVFDIYLLAESLETSILIFATFYFVRGLKRFEHKSFFLSGLFLAWCAFIKPICLPVAGLFAVILVSAYIKQAGCGRITFNLGKAAFLLLACLIFLESAWIARNYRIYGRFIPAQKSLQYEDQGSDEIYMGLAYFLNAWGGDFTWWNPKAEMCWFGYMSAGGHVDKQVKDIKFPSYIYTSKFNYNSLVSVKNYIALSQTATLPQSERAKYRRLAAERLREYADSIKKEKPYVYYIVTPFRMLRILLIHSGTYNLFHKIAAKLNVFELGFKLLMSTLYLFVLIGGTLGVFYLFFKNGIFHIKSLMAIMAAYFTLIFPFGFRTCEYRYFAQTYPFMMVCALYFTGSIYKAVVKKYLKRRL